MNFCSQLPHLKEVANCIFEALYVCIHVSTSLPPLRRWSFSNRTKNSFRHPQNLPSTHWDSSVHITFLQYICLRQILTQYFYQQHLPSNLFPWDFPTKILLTYLLSYMCDTHFTHFILNVFPTTVKSKDKTCEASYLISFVLLLALR